MREENGVKVFTDMKAFYKFIQGWHIPKDDGEHDDDEEVMRAKEAGIYVDTEKQVWLYGEIIAKFEFTE